MPDPREPVLVRGLRVAALACATTVVLCGCDRLASVSRNVPFLPHTASQGTIQGQAVAVAPLAAGVRRPPGAGTPGAGASASAQATAVNATGGAAPSGQAAAVAKDAPAGRSGKAARSAPDAVAARTQRNMAYDHWRGEGIRLIRTGRTPEAIVAFRRALADGGVSPAATQDLAARWLWYATHARAASGSASVEFRPSRMPVNEEPAPVPLPPPKPAAPRPPATPVLTPAINRAAPPIETAPDPAVPPPAITLPGAPVEASRSL